MNDLIPEILSIIISKLDGQALRAIRLTSKELKVVADPYSFTYLTINFSEACAEKTSNILDALAAGTNPCSAWTKHLALRCPPPLHSAPTNTADASQLANETGIGQLDIDPSSPTFLSAFKALGKVQSVEVQITCGETRLGIIDAIASLPGMRSLDVSYFVTRRLVRVRGHLRQFVLAGIRPTNVCSALEVVKLITSRPEDGELIKSHILSWRKPTSAENSSATSASVVFWTPWLYQLWIDTCELPDFLCGPALSTLRTLYVRSPNFSDDGSASTDETLFGALLLFGVRLQTLEVAPISAAAHQYLSSYEGLVNFEVTPMAEQADEAAEATFSCVLPQHRKTLLNFEVNGTRRESLAWAITPKRLEHVLLCEKLETLGLVYHFPVNPPTPQVATVCEGASESHATEQLPHIDLSLLLTQLTGNLPHLQRLTLVPVRPGLRNNQDEELNIYGSGPVTSHLERLFVDEVGKLRFDVAASGKRPAFDIWVRSMQVHGITHITPLMFDGGKSRFVALNTAKYFGFDESM